MFKKILLESPFSSIQLIKFDDSCRITKEEQFVIFPKVPLDSLITVEPANL